MNTISKLILVILIIFSLQLTAEETNAKKFMFKSALIPGWGELSQKSNSGYVFLASEVVSWCSFFYFKEEAKLMDKASYNFAVKYAHIPANEDYPNDYFYQLTRYESANFENCDYIVNLAEEKFPNDLDAQMEFIDHFSWNWDDDKRSEYKILQKRKTQYGDYAKTITGAFIANRLLSVLNSVRINTKLNRLNARVFIDNELQTFLTLEYKFK